MVRTECSLCRHKGPYHSCAAKGKLKRKVDRWMETTNATAAAIVAGNNLDILVAPTLCPGMEAVDGQD